MKYMQRLAGLAVFTCLTLVNPQIGFAGILQTGDLNAIGDKLLTIDPNTGLAFLDPKATAGLSYNQALGSPFVLQQGFQFASVAQVQQLFRDAGITNFTGQFNTPDLNVVTDFVNNFIGSIIPGEATITAPAFAATVIAGDYAFTAASGNTSTVIGIDYQTAAESATGQPDARTILNFASFPLTMPAPIVGSFLVRSAPTAIPEPAGTGLLALALLAAMGFAGRVRRKLDR